MPPMKSKIGNCGPTHKWTIFANSRISLCIKTDVGILACSSHSSGARLFPYGAAAGDTRVTSKTSLTDEYVSDIIVVPHGLPVRDGELLNGVYVSKTALVSGQIER